MPDRDREVPLGGLITAAVRAGNTVRRPVAPGARAAAALLGYLESAGFTGAPRYLGRDDRGRSVLTWVVGEIGASGLQTRMFGLPSALYGREYAPPTSHRRAQTADGAAGRHLCLGA